MPISPTAGPLTRPDLGKASPAARQAVYSSVDGEGIEPSGVDFARTEPYQSPPRCGDRPPVLPARIKRSALPGGRPPAATGIGETGGRAFSRLPPGTVHRQRGRRESGAGVRAYRSRQRPEPLSVSTGGGVLRLRYFRELRTLSRSTSWPSRSGGHGFACWSRSRREHRVPGGTGQSGPLPRRPCRSV